jgi:hypothetical protein
VSVGADNFADAPELGAGANGPTPTAGLTYETGEPNTGWNGTAWWTWTPTTAEPVILSTDASAFTGDDWNYDTLIAVHTGTAVDALTQVAADDDGGDVGYFSKLLFTPEAGQTYRIQVCTWGGFDLDLSLTVLTPGPWREDSDPITSGLPSGGTTAWRSTGTRIGPDPTGLAQAALADALAGDGTLTTGSAISSVASTSINGPIPPDSHYGGNGYWDVPYTWGAQAAVDHLDLDESYLPADVFDQDTWTYIDPDVVAVEWGFPQTTGNATLAPSLSYGAYDDPGQTWRVMYRIEPDNTAPTPQYRTRGDLLSAFTVIDEPITTADVASIPGGGGYYTLPAWDVGALLAGFNRYSGQRLTFALVDKDHTIDGETPPDTSNQVLTLLAYGLSQEYVVPYRLLYSSPPAPGVAPPLRQYPRSDGRVGSAKRMLDSRSRQSGLRRVGGYL